MVRSLFIHRDFGTPVFSQIIVFQLGKEKATVAVLDNSGALALVASVKIPFRPTVGFQSNRSGSATERTPHTGAWFGVQFGDFILYAH
jgi:hypothetical protein